MKEIDDYELFDKDFDECIRRGLEAFGLSPKKEEKRREQS